MNVFSVESRGKQCAFMCLSAILTAQNRPLINWSKTTFNNVLVLGDKIYLKTLNSGLIIIEQGVEFLSVNDLPKVVRVSWFNNEFISCDITLTLICPLTNKMKVIYPLW